MVCYSNKTKSLAAKIVGVISVLVVILGLITAILGALQMGVVQKPNKWAGIEAFDESGFGTGVLILGAIAILTGLLGCATCKCKKVCFTIPFGILSFVAGLVLLILGLVLLGVASELVDKAQEGICKVSSKSNANIAQSYNDAVELYVCSEICPCDTKNKELWSKIDEKTYNEHKRTNKAELTPADVSAGRVKMVWADPATVTVYNSWKACYEGVLKKEMDKDTKYSKVKDFIEKGGLDFLESSEQRLMCAGACKKALFFATLDVSEGRPERDCVNALFDDLQGGSRPAGIIGVVTGIILLCAFAAAFPLCSGYDEDDMMKEE